MFLATMAGAISPDNLSMLSSLMTDTHDSQLIEYLMAGMWILLR
jgi:hypothetical protein